MSALSIQISDQLAKASTKAAQQRGVSRAEFIRQAIEHELENMQIQVELQGIAKSFLAMKKDPTYLKETQEINEHLNSTLPKDKKQWWKKKKS